MLFLTALESADQLSPLGVDQSKAGWARTSTISMRKNYDLTLTVKFPDDGIQEGVLRSHMAPPDGHLRCCGPSTVEDFARLSVSQRVRVSNLRSRTRDGHGAPDVDSTPPR